MNLFVTVLDFSAAIVMLALMKVITADFGLRTPQERWAMVRRVVYTLMAMALFAKGSHRLENLDAPVDYLDLIPQVMIVIGIILFPAFRALGWLTQDRFQVPGQYKRRSHDF